MIERPTDPVAGQTEETIGVYLSNCLPGAIIAVRNAQGLGIRYVITSIEDINPSIGRLYTPIPGQRGGKAWYSKTGKNCYHPKGQSRLVEPTEAVRNFASQYPIGCMVKS